MQSRGLRHVKKLKACDGASNVYLSWRHTLSERKLKDMLTWSKKYLATEGAGNQLQGKCIGLLWTVNVHIHDVLSRIHGQFEEKYLPRHTITCQGR